MDEQLTRTVPGDTQRAAPEQAAIVRWLIRRVAALVQEPAEEIDITLPFSTYALDSVTTVELTAELEDWLDIDLAPTLIWDYPSIDQLARYLYNCFEPRVAE